MRDRAFSQQIVLRVTPTMRAAIELDAMRYGRTVAQSVRFLLARGLIGEEPNQ